MSATVSAARRRPASPGPGSAFRPGRSAGMPQSAPPMHRGGRLGRTAARRSSAWRPGTASADRTYTGSATGSTAYVGADSASRTPQSNRQTERAARGAHRATFRYWRDCHPATRVVRQSTIAKRSNCGQAALVGVLIGALYVALVGRTRAIADAAGSVDHSGKVRTGRGSLKVAGATCRVIPALPS